MTTELSPFNTARMCGLPQPVLGRTNLNRFVFSSSVQGWPQRADIVFALSSVGEAALFRRECEEELVTGAYFELQPGGRGAITYWRKNAESPSKRSVSTTGPDLDLELYRALSGDEPPPMPSFTAPPNPLGFLKNLPKEPEGGEIEVDDDDDD